MNSMSLLRNSVIVGGATFLVGSALMEISKGDEKVGWWPYAATFLSGALGYYVVKQKTVPVPEALELNAEYDFKNKAMITVVADEEDEAWETFARTHNPFNDDWEIVDIREAEELQAFSAEVFMADRKIRRRTRWTWTSLKKDMLTRMPFHIPKFMITHQGKVGAITEVMSQCIRLKIPTTLAICPKAITCTCLNRL